MVTVALFAAWFAAGGEAKSSRPGCDQLFKRSAFHSIAQKVYDGQNAATAKEKRRMHVVIKCQARPKVSRPIIKKHRERYRNRHNFRRAVIAVTPYVCGKGLWMRFAVPCGIVFRESRYDWGAANPASTAVGPYQMLDIHGRPWPITSAKDRLVHHQIAYRLWAGGAGASHWAL